MTMVSLPINLNFLKKEQNVHILPIVKTDDDLCFFCQTEYTIDSLKCNNTKCGKSLCIRCCNKLSDRGISFNETCDIVENVVSTDKTLNDLFICPVMLKYKCPFCRVINRKSFDKFDKNSILELLTVDYNKFIFSIYKSDYVDCINYDKLIEEKQLINLQLNAVVITQAKELIETNKLKELIVQSDIKLNEYDIKIKELQLENSILKYSQSLYEKTLTKKRDIVKNHKKIKKLEIIEMLKNMTVIYDLDVNIDINDKGDFTNIVVNTKKIRKVYKD